MRLMLMLKVALLAGLFVASGSLGEAQAGKRVALVIGNSAYKYAGELPNPRNDAADMAAVFKGLGFQVVEGVDLDKAAFDRKIRDFATTLQGAELGVFCGLPGHEWDWSGHEPLSGVASATVRPHDLFWTA